MRHPPAPLQASAAAESFRCAPPQQGRNTTANKRHHSAIHRPQLPAPYPPKDLPPLPVQRLRRALLVVVRRAAGQLGFFSCPSWIFSLPPAAIFLFLAFSPLPAPPVFLSPGSSPLLPPLSPPAPPGPLLARFSLSSRSPSSLPFPPAPSSLSLSFLPSCPFPPSRLFPLLPRCPLPPCCAAPSCTRSGTRRGVCCGRCGGCRDLAEARARSGRLLLLGAGLLGGCFEGAQRFSVDCSRWRTPAKNSRRCPMSVNQKNIAYTVSLDGTASDLRAARNRAAQDFRLCVRIYNMGSYQFSLEGIWVSP